MTAIYRIFNFVWSLRIWYSENVFLIQLPKIDIHTSTRSLTKHKVQSKETEHSSCVSPSCTSCVISYVLYVNVKYNTRDPRAFVRNRINLIMQAFCCSCIVPVALCLVFVIFGRIHVLIHVLHKIVLKTDQFRCMNAFNNNCCKQKIYSTDGCFSFLVVSKLHKSISNWINRFMETMQMLFISHSTHTIRAIWQQLFGPGLRVCVCEFGCLLLWRIVALNTFLLIS